MSARVMGCAIVAIALMMNSGETVELQEQGSDMRLEDLLETSPVSKMIRDINEQVESDTRKQLHSQHSAILGRSLDDDIEQAAELRERNSEDIGESDDAGEALQETSKVAALRALQEAQQAVNKIHKSSMDVQTSDPSKGASTLPKHSPGPSNLAQTKASRRKSKDDVEDDDFDDDKDPVNEMKASIDAEVQQATNLNTEDGPEDPLDKAIDQISVVRAHETRKAELKNFANAKLAEEKHKEMHSANEKLAKEKHHEMHAATTGGVPHHTEILLQEFETAPGDPGETMPPSKSAPPGPPNPPVKEVQEEVPNRQALGRSTGVAPPAGDALDSALASEKGPPSTTGPASPPPPTPDPEFSQEEMDNEMDAIGAYPIGKNEAINEYVSKMTPWHLRPEDPSKPAKGPVVADKAVNTTKAPPPPPPAPPATNATNANTTSTNTSMSALYYF